MFGKKGVAPKAPWAVRLLTPDFLIDGYTDLDSHSEGAPFFQRQTGSMPLGALWLTSVRFQATGPSSGTAPTANNWSLAYSAAFVAAIPNDEASLTATRLNIADLRNAFQAELFVGPYAIRGQLLSPAAHAGDFAMFGSYHSLVVKDAVIDYRLPGAQLTGLKAPLAVVRTLLLQGIGLLG
jgi:hypothetical protein